MWTLDNNVINYSIRIGIFLNPIVWINFISSYRGGPGPPVAVLTLTQPGKKSSTRIPSYSKASAAAALQKVHHFEGIGLVGPYVV